MKTCPYCGKRYPDTASVCELDQQPLKGESPRRANPRALEGTCPACGVADDFYHVVEPRSAFNLLVYLAGGVPALIFWNAAKSRRVHCHHCGAGFNIRSTLARFCGIIFWLLVAPTIIALILFPIEVLLSFVLPPG